MSIIGLYVKAAEISYAHINLSNRDEMAPWLSEGRGHVEVIDGNVSIVKGKFFDKKDRIVIEI